VSGIDSGLISIKVMAPEGEGIVMDGKLHCFSIAVLTMIQ